MAVPLIAARGLRVDRQARGKKPFPALVDVSLEASPGELVLVLGRPGAGKTTLLEALAGLLPLCSGTVEMTGEGGGLRWGAATPAPAAVREGVGLLFQFPERQLIGRTAREDVLWGDAAAKGRGSDAPEALDRVGLAKGLWDLPVSRLSRGEKRRVALAGVLARRPRVLLLDEPAVGLDAEGQALVWGQVTSYRERGGVVVLATHWPEVALPHADRVVCLEGGRIRFLGDPAGLAEAARGDSVLRGLLPFSLRIRLALESEGPLPPEVAACRDATLLALAE